MNLPFNEGLNKQAAEQTILLNAIRNKFANNENNLGTSPPVLSIPSLKCPKSPADNKVDPPPLKLNQFILGQLNDNKLSGSLNCGSFKIPELKIKCSTDSGTLTLVEQLQLKNTNSTPNKINSLNKGIDALHICDEQKSHAIDLTTALNQCTTKPLTSSSVPKPEQTTNVNPIDFHIPFIDCDIRTETLKMPFQDAYCVTGESDFGPKRFISAPSKFGRITCLKYKNPKVSKFVDHSFAKKHKINRFCFDTKSPDDIVLASLKRKNRV